jgi:hypothetical protein
VAGVGVAVEDVHVQITRDFCTSYNHSICIYPGIKAILSVAKPGYSHRIKDKSPADYLPEIDGSKEALYMKNALCPDNFKTMAYEEFVKRRTEILIKRAEELMA